MSKQLIRHFGPASGALLLAALGLFLIAAPVVEAQDQPKPGRVKMIDTLTGHKYPVQIVGFASDGKTLVSGSGSGPLGPLTGFEIKAWDVGTRKNTATISPPKVQSMGWAASADGRTVAVALFATEENRIEIRLYDLSKNKEAQVITGTNTLAFSPNGKMLAWGEGNKIKLWNLSAGKLFGTLTVENYSFAFHPDGNILASGGPYGQASLWDVGSGDETKISEKVKGKNTLVIGSVAFSPDGKTLALSVHDEVKLWDMAAKKITKTLTGHDSFIVTMAFNKDSKILAVGTYKGKVKLWNATTGKNLITLGLHDGGISCVAFSPDGRTLATASTDKTIKLWELPAAAHTYPRLELFNPVPK